MAASIAMKIPAGIGVIQCAAPHNAQGCDRVPYRRHHFCGCAYRTRRRTGSQGTAGQASSREPSRSRSLSASRMRRRGPPAGRAELGWTRLGSVHIFLRHEVLWNKKSAQGPTPHGVFYWGDRGAPDLVFGGLTRADTRVTIMLSEGRQRLIRTCPTGTPDES
jgi:hypothetical protein